MELNLGHLIRRYRLPIAIVGILILSTGTILILRGTDRDSGEDGTNPPLVETQVSSTEGGFVDSEGEANLLISLSEGHAGAYEIVPIPTASGEPLTEEEINQIVARLPELVLEPGDESEFNLPEDSLPTDR
jgi:hypothetical protein